MLFLFFLIWWLEAILCLCRKLKSFTIFLFILIIFLFILIILPSVNRKYENLNSYINGI